MFCSVRRLVRRAPAWRGPTLQVYLDFACSSLLMINNSAGLLITYSADRTSAVSVRLCVYCRAEGSLPRLRDVKRMQWLRTERVLCGHGCKCVLWWMSFCAWSCSRSLESEVLMRSALSGQYQVMQKHRVQYMSRINLNPPVWWSCFELGLSQLL